ncbi:hypothetical protein Q5752_001320 [Cryptotrichosporon argae]
MSTQPLLPGRPERSSPARRLVGVVVPVLLIVGVAVVTFWGENKPTDPLKLANYYLKRSPVIDGHIDLPEFARSLYGNNLSAFDLDAELPGHVDIPRIKKGYLGGFFWSVYTDCVDTGSDFLTPSNSVRDTLEQIDVSLNLIDKYSDTFALATTADEVEATIRAGKVASLLGVEGAHQFGNSLGVVRQYHRLGVRYATLTHSCNNAFADSAGIFQPIEEKWGGLSKFGVELVKEMNRVGILVDISHVSDQTALAALAITKAPVILSHSAARHFNDINRNVPDAVLDKLGRKKHQVDGVVMVNFYPSFASGYPGEVDTAYIADEIEYISKRIGVEHVGIGSDYDGIESTPDGLEDVSTYPHLFAELIRRGWSEYDLALLAGGNVLRVMRGMEAASAQLRKSRGPSMATYDKRTDLGRGLPI